MTKLNNSNFELLEDIIKSMDFNYNPDICNNIDLIQQFWCEITGDKISKISRVYDIKKNGTLIIICADSFVSNELYLQKDKLLKNMKEKADKAGIKIEDIKFDYTKWKEKNDE